MNSQNSGSAGFPDSAKVSEKKFNAAWIPSRNAKLVKDSIMQGTAPFLPDEKGVIDAQPVYNGMTGYCLDARSLIPVQLVKKDGFSNVVVGKKAVDAAQTYIKKDVMGFMYNFQRDDKTVGTARYYFPEQTEHPDRVLSAVQGKLRKPKFQLPEIEMDNPDPAEYLAKYVAACKTGTAVHCSPEIAEAFKKNIMPILDNQLSRYNRQKDPSWEGSPFSHFLFRVDMISNAIVKDMRMMQRMLPSQSNPEKSVNRETAGYSR